MKPITYILAVGLSVLMLTAGCDKKTKKPPSHPVPEDVAQQPPQTQPQPRASRWKAHDAHTHLSSLSYPLAIELMNQNGLYRMANLSGGHSEKSRQHNLERADRYPGRIALFFNVDWSGIERDNFGETMAESLEEAVESGFAGLKISKALGLSVETEDGELLAVDAPRLDPLWEKAGKLGIPVSIHTGDPKAFFEKPGPDNERWEELKLAPSWSFYGEEYPSRKALLDARDRMVARHPYTTFILVHFANNPEDLDYVEAVLEEHPNAMLDVSARIAEIGRHDPERVRKLFIEHQDRILFATDLGVRVRPAGDGRLQYALTLGSISKEPPSLKDVRDFYEDHWRYFETDEEAIEHPVPIQGDWKVHPIDLGQEVLEKVYYKNAERIIFAPWLGRRAAHGVLEKAREQSGHAQQDADTPKQ